MAKKTKDETINFLYVNEEKEKKPKKKRNNKNVPKKTESKDDIINLDNEIIIGLTPKKEAIQTKKETEKKKQVKNPKKKQSKNTKITKKPPTQKTKKKASKVKQNKNYKISTRIKIKILKWTGLCILLIGIVIAFMLSPIFNIKQINVEGVQKLLSEEIINLSQIQLNENTFKIKVRDVINKIEAHTYIEEVSINRELPNTIKIIVKERQPQYIIETEFGYAYIDSKGYILEISEETLELPILNGYGTRIENIIDFENTKKLSDEDCTKVETVSQVVEAARNNGILSYINSIDISDATNIKLNLDTEKKVAYFGDCSNANIRILFLKKMIEEEAGKEGEAYINGDLQKPKPYFREKV